MKMPEGKLWVIIFIGFPDRMIPGGDTIYKGDVLPIELPVVEEINNEEG